MAYRDSHHALITQLYRELAQFAAGIVPKKLPLEPSRDDVMAQADEINLIISKVDPLIEAIANYVEDHAGYRIGEQYKLDQLRQQLDGNLLYEISQAADEAHERLMEGAA